VTRVLSLDGRNKVAQINAALWGPCERTAGGRGVGFKVRPFSVVHSPGCRRRLAASRWELVKRLGHLGSQEETCAPNHLGALHVVDADDQPILLAWSYLALISFEEKLEPSNDDAEVIAAGNMRNRTMRMSRDRDE
jgi:hypothetical protein